MGKPIAPVVIDRQWNVSSLLGETFRLLWRHAGLFLPLAAAVVVPLLLSVHLVWGEDSADWGLSTGSVAGVVIPVLLTWILMPACVTALYGVALLRILDGERPSFAEVVRAAVPRLPAVIGATAWQIVAIAAGLVALVVPGLYLATLLWLAPQAVVAEGLSAGDALKRSAELVRGRWWQTTGRLLLAFVVVLVGLTPLWMALSFIGYGAAFVAVDILGQLLLFSFLTLFGMLMLVVYRTGSS